MPNRLAHETSPYLLQHADNPVDWYPWCDLAFERARREERPVFLSIGYATCHWCHVMEHESFEDPVVAALMNEAFVNIKVDREERPDVDQVYMTVCQMLTGSGGWPLTILMTPEKRPFFAATYIPRTSVYGRVGMLEMVPRVQQLWQSERHRLLESAQQIVGHLETAAALDRSGDLPPDLGVAAARQLASRFDAAHGGFGDRPKFPSPHNLLFLLRHGWRTGDAQAVAMVTTTLEAMRRGGIFDHVGYGFHRYSTDREWLVPHFEKMLYDQAMLTLAYAEAYAATGREDFRRTADEIVTYVLRDLSSPDGGLCSAEDADSEGEEGKFYLWSADEIRSILDERQAALVVDVFNVEEAGNYLDESTGSRTGANILHLREGRSEVAARLELEPAELDRRLESARAALHAARERRVHPLKDDKILADWNGLMAAALARAGSVLDSPPAVAAAARAVGFVHGSMRAGDGRLLHRYRAGMASVPAFLDDYAFLTWACLELYDATLDAAHLERAVELADEAVARFWDPATGGFFFSGVDAEELLCRQKEVYDGAIPSGNSVAMASLVRLARLTGRPDHAERADCVARAFAADLRAAPSAHCHLIAAVEQAAAPSLEVVIGGVPHAESTRRLIEVARRPYLPDATLLLVPDGEAGDLVRRLAPFTESLRAIGSEAAAYVCRNFACQLPTTDPQALAQMLEAEAKQRSA